VADDEIGTGFSTPPAWKVLIVDHEEEVHNLARAGLKNLFFGDRKVELLNAYSAEEALEFLLSQKGIAVAIIDLFLDHTASDVNLVHTIRRDLNDKQLRIILRTGGEDTAPEEKLIIDYDINDYKHKRDFTGGRLRSALITAFRSYRDLGTISELNTSLEHKVRDRTTALMEANLKLRSYISRLENDHAAGGRMQQKLLPDTQKTFSDCTFSSRIYSSMYLSGDFLDYFEIDDHRIGFYMADVSGHGISSAFITVLLKNFIDIQLENYWNEGDSMIIRPYMLVKRLNNELLRENFGKYLTIFYGVLDLKKNTLRYTNCGQFPYPLLRDNGGIRALSQIGTPVGLFVEPEFIEEEIEVSQHAALLLVSDGILELLPQASIKEKRNLLRSIFSQTGLSLQDITEKLGLSRQYSFPDDITFLMMKRSGLNGSG